MTGKPIVIDCRMWDHPGIGRYLRELASRLVPLLAGRDCRLLAHPRERAKILRDLPAREGVTLTAVRAPIYSAAEQVEVPWAARGAALLHVPHFNIPLAWRGRLVATVHDLIYAHDSSGLRRAYARALIGASWRGSSAVITVSEHTRRDLVATFGADGSERVHVIPEAASASFGPTRDPEALERARRRHSLDRPFVLFVGSLKPHKNVPTLVRAFRRLWESGRIKHQLVLVGRPDPKDREWSRLAGESAFVRELGVLPDAELKSLYQLADLFVLPSTREGFGLPVLEAMACGTPVICSNAASLPEVGGDAALYFDPGQIDALSDLLYTVLQDEALRKKMSRMGLERAETFSWERAARLTLRVYERVLA